MSKEIINVISEMVFCLLDVVLLYRFTLLSLKLNFWNKAFVILISLLTAFIAFFMSFISTYSWLSTIVLLGSIFIYVIIIFQGEIKTKIIISLLYYLILGLLTALVSSISIVVFSIPTKQLFENAGIRIGIALVIKLLYLMIIEIVRKYTSSSSLITSKSIQYFFWLSFISLLVLFESLFLDMSVSSQYTIQYMSVVFVIFFVIVFVVLIRYYNNREKVLHMTVLLEESRVKKQEAVRHVNHNLNLMSVKHDLKNHLIVLKHYIKQFENEQAIKYIEKMESLDAFKTYVHSENQILNAVLNAKISENQDIDFRIRLDIETFDFDSMLLTIVLGNILDNAIEAVENLPREKRIINVIISENKQHGKIAIDNPYHKAPRIKNGKLYSLKRDNSVGLGLTSVERIIKDYDGIMEYGIDNQIFRMVILLKKHNSHLNIPNSH